MFLNLGVIGHVVNSLMSLTLPTQEYSHTDQAEELDAVNMSWYSSPRT